MKNKIFEKDEILEYSRSVFSGTDQKAYKFKEYLNYYYLGAEDQTQNNLKRLFGEINRILSLIYTPSFMILDPVCNVKDLSKEQRELLDAIVKEVYDNFVTYNRLDIEIKDAILHALIYGYTPIKVFWKGNGVIYKEIDPRNFGIMYESLDITDRQQIIGHRTYMTADKIKFLYGIDYEKKYQIHTQKLQQSGYAYLMAVAKGTAVIDASRAVDAFKPWELSDAKPLVEVIEIYLNEYYRTSKDVWHKFVIIPKLNKIVDHNRLTGLRHPFFIMSLYPIQNSSLGISLIEMVKEIQKKRIETLSKISEITALRTYPPMIIRGAAVNADQLREDIKQLWTERGFLSIQDPQAMIDTFPPSTGLQELYEMIEYWNMQLKYVTGLHEVILGEPQRTRMGKGIELMAAFASSTFRDLAHRVEAVLEDIFTFAAYLYRINYDEPVKIGDKSYRFSDFPYDFRINIRSHTASPIDIKIIQDIFFAMYKMGDIPADMLFDLFNLPFKGKYLEYKKEKMAAKLFEKAIEKKSESES